MLEDPKKQNEGTGSGQKQGQGSEQQRDNPANDQPKRPSQGGNAGRETDEQHGGQRRAS